MILLGIGFGDSRLGWIELDGAVELLYALGLAHLLLVAGLEIRLDLLRGRTLMVGVASFVISCGVAVGVGAGLYAADLVDDVGVVVAGCSRRRWASMQSGAGWAGRPRSQSECHSPSWLASRRWPRSLDPRRSRRVPGRDRGVCDQPT